MPEQVVPTEGVAVLGCKCLDADAARERAGAARWLRGVPFAAVLSDNVIEESSEDVGRPGRI